MLYSISKLDSYKHHERKALSFVPLSASQRRGLVQLVTRPFFEETGSVQRATQVRSTVVRTSLCEQKHHALLLGRVSCSL
jgi:hypothetical protein